MLATSVTISASSGGPGTYSATVFFTDSSKAQFIQVGDTLEDRLGNQYEITTWSTFPSDFVSGGSMTVNFITSDVAPATFNSVGDGSVYSPGQVDVRPAVQSAGIMSAQVLNSGQSFLYDLTCGWFDTVSAANATTGDHIMDASGKVYVITVTNSGATSVTAQELIKEGISPTLGDATLYRATTNINLFQGTPVSDPARTVVRNKDDYHIDAKFKEIEDALSAGVGSLVSAEYDNTTGSSINPLTAVCTDSSGNMKVCNPGVEADTLAFKGISTALIADATSGTVAKIGLIQNISTTFAFQADLYVAKDGSLTDSPPAIDDANGFVAGDFVIYIGHISRNEDNPANKDLELKPQIIGQL